MLERCVLVDRWCDRFRFAMAAKVVAKRPRVESYNDVLESLIDKESVDKYYQVNWNDVVTNNDVIVIDGLAAPAQGTTSQEMIGSRFEVKRLRVKGLVTIGRDATVASLAMLGVRVMLVCDTQCNGAAMTESMFNGFSGVSNIISVQPMPNASKHVAVLRDTTLTVGPQIEVICPFEFEPEAGTGVLVTEERSTCQSVPFAFDVDFTKGGRCRGLMCSRREGVAAASTGPTTIVDNNLGLVAIAGPSNGGNTDLRVQSVCYFSDDC